MSLKIIKILISLPLFLWVIIGIHLKYKNKIKKNKTIKEESLYKWVNRYSHYLFWIFKTKKVIIHNYKLWDTKKNLIILNQINWLSIFYLIKKNNFNFNSPISLFLEKKEIANWPKLIVKYFLLINNFVLININNKKEMMTKITLAIENIQIPRSLILALETNKENMKKLLKVAYGGYSKILFIKVREKKEKIDLIIEKCLTAKRIITIKPENILKMFNY